MRSPTPADKVYAFHSRALAGAKEDVREDEPEAGWWKMRLAKGCCWVPVRIWLVQDVLDGELVAPEVLKCTVDGEERDPRDVWQFCCQRPIAEHEWRYLTALRSWQKINEPDAWDPYRPVVMTETAIED